MKKLSIPEIEKIANLIRQDVIEMTFTAQSGHPAGALGMADILAALYFEVLNHKPLDPYWNERDRLVLSNGHICAGLYSALARAGYFPVEELKTFRKLGSRLQGHPHNLSLPGLETSSGPLGQGFSQALGMCLAAKMDKANWRVYLLTSDGEHQEGQTWEAIMFAGARKLNNLTAILDRNKIQIDGFTEEVMSLEPLKEKYLAFNWRVLEIEGDNLAQFLAACEQAKNEFFQPTMIIAQTIPGKGVSFMENNPAWHGKPPNAEEAKKALEELKNR